MECTDPFVKKLRSKAYYMPAYKKTNIKKLDVYKTNIENKLTRLFLYPDLEPENGTVLDLFDKPEGGIGTRRGEGETIDTIITEKHKTDISAKAIANYLNALLPQDKKKEKKIEENQIKAILSNTKTVVFKIDDIEVIDINQLALKDFLNNNQKRLKETFEEDIKDGRLYVLTSLLRSKKITMTLERNTTTQIAANIAQLMDLQVSGKFEHLSESSESDKLLYENPDEGLVIAIRLARLTYSQKGILTIDKNQDFKKVLDESSRIEPDYFETDETFLEFG